MFVCGNSIWCFFSSFFRTASLVSASLTWPVTKSKERAEMIESNGTLTEFLTTFQNYASCNRLYLVLILAQNIRILPQRSCNFVQFLNNFSRCHDFSFKKQRGLDRMSVWERQLVLVFMLNYHCKWFSNRWNGRTEEWWLAVPSFVCYIGHTFWTLFPQFSYLN